MPDQHVTVAVTGAAGHIGYALVFRIASGQMFGPQTSVDLRLLELEAALPSLEGVAMELEDCAFPLLRGVTTTASADEAFRGANWALLVGAVPRGPGMERKDLLGINAGIFNAQGQSIAANAAEDVRVLVVGNPCNTNCLIASRAAPDIPRDRWFAMTMLDETRGRALLARRAGATVAEVRDLVIWGNHSSTQFPDAFHATIGGRAAAEIINDDAWLRGEFITTVQQRGAAVLKARGASSAASAANAAIDSVRSIVEPTPTGDWHSVCLHSDGSYDVELGLISSFPVRSNGRKLEIVQGLPVGEFSRRKIDATVNELKEERSLVGDLIPK